MNTLSDRVVAFYDDNPDEELTKDDAQVKFDARRGAVEAVFGLLTQSGFLIEDRERSGRGVVGAPRKVWRKAP